MHGLEAYGVDVFENFVCGIQGSRPLVCGFCWECSSAATHHNLRSLPGSRCLLWRPLCSHRLSFWILFRMLGLMPLPVRIYCLGEYEVQDDVPAVVRGWTKVYRHLRPLHQTLGKLLLLVLQHGCGSLT